MDRTVSIATGAAFFENGPILRMVALLNPSTTIGTHGMDGNLWSRSAKPSLPSVKHVGRHQTGALNDMVESYEWYGW